MRRVGLFPVFAASILVSACSSSTAALAPIDWERVPGSGPGGALLGPNTTPGSFDQVGNFTVSAFKDGNIVRLYYGGAGVERREDSRQFRPRECVLREGPRAGSEIRRLP